MASDAVAPHSPLGVGAAPDARCIANKWTERQRHAEVVSRVPSNATRILDVGCIRHSRARRGYGNLHAQLHVSFPDAHIIGIDTDREGIEQMHAPGYDVRQMNASALDFQQEFDAIVAGEVIEHLENPGLFFASAADHLHPGAPLVITTPNPNGVRFFRKAWNGAWTSKHHTCWISPQHLSTLAGRAAGLDVVDLSYIRPPGGLSAWLYGRGRERVGATQYVATLQEGI